LNSKEKLNVSLLRTSLVLPKGGKIFSCKNFAGQRKSYYFTDHIDGVTLDKWLEKNNTKRA